MMAEVRKYLQSLRVAETLFLSGMFLAGAVFGLKEISMSHLVDIVLLCCMGFLLIGGLYAFNAWGDMASDVHNTRLESLRSRSGVFWITHFGLMITAALALSYLISSTLWPYLIILFGLGTIYSLPRIGLKNIPYLGTILHFLFLTTAFNASYDVFTIADETSLMFSFYFALLFSGGHLHHEAIDFESDVMANSHTSAAVKGLQRAALMSFGLFTFAEFFWIALYCFGLTNALEFLSFSIAYVIQLFFFVGSFKSFEQEWAARIRYRLSYRIAYLLGGVAVFLDRVFPSFI